MEYLSIDLKSKHTLWLFLAKKLRCFSFKKYWPEEKKVIKIYDEGKEKLKKEIDIIRIVKKIRKLNILMKD